MANKVFELFGTIGLRGVDEVDAQLDGTTQKAKKSGESIQGAFSKIGTAVGKVAKIGAAATAAVATGIGALTSKAVNFYSEYEQLVGGVETLFKDAADSVIDNASNAYKTAGMSANDYMETVTGFSASLLQSLGGDTVKAAKKADMAITDMADNANKMGTSMESIQNAYQGFAKQNYTMLDNLKLGYGGTKEEMERLLEDAEKISGIKYDISSYADVVDAIHVMQESMGIAGTTSKEAATTIQGSIGMMKSAWENFMTGMSDPDQDFDTLLNNFVDSVVTACENIVPRIAATLPRIVKGLIKIIQKLSTYIPGMISELLPALIQGANDLMSGLVDSLPQIIQTINEVLPSLIDCVINLMSGIVDAMPDILQTLLDALPAIIDGITQLFYAIIDALPDILQTLVDALPELIQMIMDALPELIPQIVDAIVGVAVTLMESLPQILQPIIDALPTIITTVVDALMQNLPALIQGCVQLVIGIVQALPQIIAALLEALPTVISSIVEGLFNSFPILLEGVTQILGELWNAICLVVQNLGEWLGTTFSDCWDAIKEIFAPVAEFFTGAFSNARDGIEKAFDKVGDFFGGVWTNIKEAFGSVGTWFKDTFSEAWKKVKDVFCTGGKVFDGIKEGIETTFKTVVNGLINGINKVITIPFDAINGMLNKIRNVGIGKVRPFKNLWDENPISTPQIPLLEKGGVLKRGQVGFLEGNGDEAVVPLSQNTEWIDRVADKLNSNGNNTDIARKLDEVVDAIKALKLYINGTTLVGAIAEEMDSALGQVQVATERGM